MEIQTTPVTPLANQTTTFERNDRFTQDFRIMVATPMHALASILRDVPGGGFPGVAELHVDDERIAGYIEPSPTELPLLDPVALSQNVNVHVPAIVTPTTLDFEEEYAALLRLAPQDAATQASEGSVNPIDVLRDLVVGFAKGQGDES